MRASVIDWLRSRFFGRRSLDAIDGASRVRVRGRLVGEERCVSPMTGRRGLLVEYRFWDRHVLDTISSHQRPMSFVVPLVASRLGEALVVGVEGRKVVVPLTDEVRITFMGRWDPGTVPHLLPDAYARAHPELDRFTEELRYDEKVLHADQEVELAGFVEPVPRGLRSAYRGGNDPGWDFEARPKLGRIELRELLMDRLA